MTNQTVTLDEAAWDLIVLSLKAEAQAFDNGSRKHGQRASVQAIMRGHANRVLALALEIDAQRSSADPIASRKA